MLGIMFSLACFTSQLYFAVLIKGDFFWQMFIWEDLVKVFSSIIVIV